jgi:hypothetical protein
MLNNREIYTCRVCGLQQDDPPWGEDGNTPSFNICDCCGIEFGYEDATIVAIKKMREKWLSEGTVWSEPKAKPKDWTLEVQLEQIPDAFR